MSDRAAVPSWVIDGWYANNPDKQQLAIARYSLPVTSPGELDRLRAYTASAPAPVTYPCFDCGKFAFSQPTLCYWCGKRGES